MSVVNTAGSADITKESKTKLLQNLRDEVVQLKLTATEHQETLDRVIKWFVEFFSPLSNKLHFYTSFPMGVLFFDVCMNQASEAQLWPSD